MTASPDTDRECAETEAAAWLVRLAEEPEDAGLRQAFKAWRDASPLNAEIWARTDRAYALVGATPPRHQVHWRPGSQARVAGGTRQGRPRRRLLMAAAAAAAACLALVLASRAVLLMQADYTSATAELRSVVLDDGTRVRLAPESAIDIAFGDDGRRVRLLRGEAFFEVAPDALRPFQVVAGDTVATVLGTAFDVRRDVSGASIAVQHGQVRVSDETARPPVLEHLRAGDWLRLGRAGMARGSVRPEEVATWRQSELVARDRPIGEIVEELRRHFGGMILLRDEAFARRRVSGIYSLADPAATLRALAAAHGAAVRQVGPWVLLVTAD